MRPCITAFTSLLLLSCIVGCDSAPWGYTTIGEITKAPSSFEGRELKVKGTVTDSMKIPLTDIRFFKLSDGTGEITVFARAELPPVNGKVGVKGKVENALVIGGVPFGTHLAEERRL